MATTRTGIGSIDNDAYLGNALGQQGNNIVIVDIVTPTPEHSKPANPDLVPTIISNYYSNDRAIQPPLGIIEPPSGWLLFANNDFTQPVKPPYPDLMDLDNHNYDPGASFAVLVGTTVYIAYKDSNGNDQADSYTPADANDTIYVSFGGGDLLVYWQQSQDDALPPA